MRGLNRGWKVPRCFGIILDILKFRTLERQSFAAHFPIPFRLKMITWSRGSLHSVSIETGYTKYSTILIDIKRSRLRLWYLGDDAMRYISQSWGNRGERTSFSTGYQLHVQCHLRLSNWNSFYENTGKSTKFLKSGKFRIFYPSKSGYSIGSGN